MPRPLQAVREAAIDGRAQNCYFRQKQLRNLHSLLSKNGGELQSAIAHDAGSTTSEAQLEYLLALSCVKEHYSQLDPEKALEEEYSVARGVDAPGIREGVGLVFIQPSSHFLFYSVLAPLSAAVAAGNVVVIHLENTTRTSSLTSLLRKLLPKALDPDTIELVSSKPPEQLLGSQFIEVLQDPDPDAPLEPKANQLISPNHFPAIAVVDRTADLQNAAKAVVAARFNFGGGSPYAPDIILVNEFARKDFLDAVFEESFRSMTEAQTANGSAENDSRRPDRGIKHAVDELKEADGVRVLTSVANGSILEAQNRSSPALHTKHLGPTLLIHSIRSLDDAIDVANACSPPAAGLLASYLFAAPTSAKYLSQFITARASFINHIPLELLVGPAAPLTSLAPLDPLLRYPADLFTTPRPAVVTASRLSGVFAQVLGRKEGGKAGAKKGEELRRALAEVNEELPPSMRRMKPGQVGFFEQGILVGLGIYLVPTVATLVAAGWFGVRTVRSRWG